MQPQSNVNPATKLLIRGISRVTRLFDRLVLSYEWKRLAEQDQLALLALDEQKAETKYASVYWTLFCRGALRRGNHPGTEIELTSFGQQLAAYGRSLRDR